jgi:long-chain fatty acid transport protein
MRASLALAIAIAAVIGASTARANPLDTFGFGSRESSMGSAAAADCRDFTASYYNPAELARAPSLAIAIGYVRAEHALAIDGRDTDVDPVRGMNGGIVAPGTILGIPFAFGLALHLPDDRLSRVRALRQEQPRWELYDNRNQRLFLAANVAVSPLPWLQIGGGLSFMSSTEGRLDISGSANIFSAQRSQLRHAVDADLTAIRYPQVGVRVAIGEKLALAAVYRGQFALRLDLAAYLHGDISGLTTAYYALETRSVNNFLPQQIVLGGSYAITGDVRANVDVTWIDWSAYRSPVAELDVALDIPPPAGGWPANITPPTTPAPAHIAPIAMHDRVVPHVGIEWRAVARARWEAFVRAGYEWARSPLGAQTGVTNYVDRDRHTVSFGLGARVMELLPELPRDLRLDAHVQRSELPSGVTEKASAADLVGDYTAGGHIWSAGATLTAGF